MGPETSTIDATKIAALLGWREDTDLEFKQDLNRTPRGQSDLASDVAAMANGHGGVIVVGVREEDTRAVELTPLRRIERREDRTDIFQALAEFVTPTVSADIQQVSASDGGYFLVLTVSKSHRGPHAFHRPGKPDLRYPVREGTRKRHLTEPEMADRYRGRFRQASALIDRLDQVHTEGEEILLRSDDRRGWLLLSLVPEDSGHFEIEMTTPSVHTEWLRQLARDVGPMQPDYDDSIQGTVAFRRVLIGDWRDFRPGGVPMFTHCQFHQDGPGFFAKWCSFDQQADEIPRYKPPLNSPLAENESRTVLVTTAERLFDRIVVGLSALARHAVDHCGSDGDAVVSASLLSLGRVESMITASSHQIEGFRQTPGTRELQKSARSNHTLPLRAIHTPSVDMMIATRLLMADLLSLFGQAGVAQIAEDGSLLADHFFSDLRPDRIRSWSQRWEIPT